MASWVRVQFNFLAPSPSHPMGYLAISRGVMVRVWALVDSTLVKVGSLVDSRRFPQVDRTRRGNNTCDNPQIR